jgi:hypothetical protein
MTPEKLRSLKMVLSTLEQHKKLPLNMLNYSVVSKFLSDILESKTQISSGNLLRSASIKG